MGLTVDSSQLTFLSISNSRDTKTRKNINVNVISAAKVRDYSPFNLYSPP